MKCVLPTNLLFLFLVPVLFSCASQSNSEEVNAVYSIGQKVTEIDSKIYAIHQDTDSNYWFGSGQNGVYYSNGKTIIHYSTKDGLVSDNIFAIDEDHLGNLFFSTTKGISKFDGKKFSTLPIVVSEENEWKLNPTDLWFKADFNKNEVLRYDGKQLYSLRLPEHDLKKAFGKDVGQGNYSVYGIYSLYKDSKGNQWFGTLSAGAFRLSSTSLDWIIEKEFMPLEDGRVPGMRSIIEDKDGKFWFSNSLNRYEIKDAKNGQLIYDKLQGIDVPKENAMSFAYFMSAAIDNNDQDLWMTTYADGVWRYDGENLVHYKMMDGKTEVLLYSMYKDLKGTIWLGTHNAGAYCWNGEEFVKFVVK